jgi:hypothetical protein
MFQLQYRVVHTQDDIVFADFVEFFSAPQGASLDVDTITLHLRCTYNGTYLLRLFPDLQQHSSSATVQPSSAVPPAAQQRGITNCARNLFHVAARTLSSSTSSTPAPTTASSLAAVPVISTLPLNTTLQVQRKSKQFVHPSHH